ncbi:hypothetical protein LVJ82_17270 [Vitreoscilla massiliensis]|uniref:PilZ domain-containing protein n=1 Tax=Vitreoscilla massiliensis TaxID=1689272 RepID=A0ABY4E059_9NEIS|nr:hypothetical protein [Vitreoscilla massiliensis]UOO89171.1 hypothetical protein LVJ82_17270 [Vitreoscilla massiliensis]
MVRPKKDTTTSPAAEVAQGTVVGQNEVVEAVTPLSSSESESVVDSSTGATEQTQDEESPIQPEEPRILSFPRKMVVSNLSPTAFTIPQFSILVPAGEQGLEVVVKNADQLNLAKLNIGTFNSLNRWDGVHVGLILEEMQEDVE